MLQKSSSVTGSDGYVFVSYSHRNAKQVTKEIRALEKAGISAWYDDAIRPGHRWRVELAHAIEGCSALLFFATESSVQSNNCEQEVTYAAEHKRPLLQIQLEETELPTEFSFTLSAHQAIRAWELPRNAYRSQLADSLHSLINGTEVSQGEATHRRLLISRDRRPFLLTAAATLVLLIFAATYWTSTNNFAPSTSSEVTFQASARSIAVMRFLSIGESTSIGDGLCEHLLHLLTRMKEVAVPSRTSSWQLTNENIGAKDVARRLGVRYVLEGSVQRIDDRVRVTAQLIDGLTGLHVWSDTYNEQLSANSFFEIQDQIATKLMEHLEVTLSNESASLLAQRPTSDSEALDAYLKGRSLRRGPNTDQNISDAQAAFQQALELDPDYAEAHAALCESHLAAYSVHRDEERFNTAKDHCLKAQRINQNEVMVLSALGTLYRSEGRLADAEVEIRKARTMAPHNVAVMEEQGRLFRAMGRSDAAEAVFDEAIRTEPGNWSGYKSMGNFMMRSGRFNEAIGLYQQALRLDPGNPVAENNLATAMNFAGQFGPAGELWAQLAEKSPGFLTFVNLANSRFYQGAYEEAITWYGRAIERADTDFRGYGGRAASREYATGLASALADYQQAADLAKLAVERNRQDPLALSRLSFYQAKLGHTTDAREGLQRLTELPALDPDSRFMVALTQIALGDVEIARQSLADAVSAGFPEALVRADPLVAQINERDEVTGSIKTQSQ
jgi:tetratricopeptide (TPR) repeat protein/TolB-like protein